MIKPDGVQRGLVGTIIQRFEQKGYKLVAMKQVYPAKEHMEAHYEDLKDKAFFPGLISYMVRKIIVISYSGSCVLFLDTEQTSGPVIAMVCLHSLLTTKILKMFCRFGRVSELWPVAVCCWAPRTRRTLPQAPSVVTSLSTSAATSATARMLLSLLRRRSPTGSQRASLSTRALYTHGCMRSSLRMYSPISASTGILHGSCESTSSLRKTSMAARSCLRWPRLIVMPVSAAMSLKSSSSSIAIRSNESYLQRSIVHGVATN